MKSTLIPLVKAIGQSSLEQCNTFPYLSKVILATVQLSENVLKECCTKITRELSSYCSTKNPSILRQKSKEQLQSFKWDALYAELQTMCPIFCQFLESATHNPSAKQNKVKTHTHIQTAVCSAGAKLISIFNDDMNAVRHLNSIMLKKGGLKKIGFVRLCATYDSMSYLTTNKIQENLGKNHDHKVLAWKTEIEAEMKYEDKLLTELHKLEKASTSKEKDSTELAVLQCRAELQDFRKTLHPGTHIHVFTHKTFSSISFRKTIGRYGDSYRFRSFPKIF